MKAAILGFLALNLISMPKLSSAATDSAASAEATPSEQWQPFTPIPDAIGFAGMFAGTSGEGRVLLSGGGSQFPDKPLWAGGDKVHSARIYLLEQPDGPWRCLDKLLPTPRSLMASATYRDAVIVAGGMNDKECLDEVLQLQWLDGQLVIKELPKLPKRLALTAAATVGSRLYLAGGISALSAAPTNSCWVINLDSPASSMEWERLADLPCPGLFASAGATDGEHFYVIGGLTILPSTDGKTGLRKTSDSVYRFDPRQGQWELLPPLPAPRAGACAFSMPNREVFITGGYAHVFTGELKDHPGFDSETFIYNPNKKQWRQGPSFPCVRHIDSTKTASPGPEPTCAAAATIWQNSCVVISGEVRPATRTPAVLALPIGER